MRAKPAPRLAAARQILTDARRVDHDARALSRGCVECRVLAGQKGKGERPNRAGKGRSRGHRWSAVRFWHPEMEGTLTVGTKRGHSIKNESLEGYFAQSSCIGPVDCLVGHVASVRLLPAGDETQALLAAGSCCKIPKRNGQAGRHWVPALGWTTWISFCELKGRIRRG